jgi:GST-like protein
MIDLYASGTINGRRAALALAECELPHRIHHLNLERGDQKAPSFVQINPRGQIPVIVDHDADAQLNPISVSQSGAIVLYCAEKSGKLLSSDIAARAKAFEWFAHALSDAGSTSSALFQLSLAPAVRAETVSYFKQRLLRHFSHCDAQLKAWPYLAGEFSIADVALFPIVAAPWALLKDSEDGFIDRKAWAQRMFLRPNVARVMAAFESVQTPENGDPGS